MELLISFLLALGVFTFDPKTTTATDVEKARQLNHNLLLENYGQEYARIIGTDQTEEQ